MRNFVGQDFFMKSAQKLQIKLLQYYFNSLGLLWKKQSAKELLKLFSTPRSRVIREKEVEVLQKAKVEAILLDKERINIYQWGAGEKKVLLCHGWESNAGSLGAFVEPLNQLGYTVIAYDGPAHGSSEGKRASLLSFTEVANEVVNRFEGIEIAIGHSLGANVVMLLSENKKVPFKKTVLISPVNKIQTVFDGFKNIFKIPDEIHNEMIALINKQSNYEVNQLEFSQVAQRSAIEKALIMHDVDDKITAFWHSESLSKDWENAELFPIEGSGHYKILWHPKTLQKTLKFIQ